MKRTLFTLLALAAVALQAELSFADVRLPKVFSDHMLLQRGLQAPVWGWADPQESITVSFAGQEKRATADVAGRWMIRLDPLEANDQGQTLTVIGNNRVQIQDVLVGDVWICSGQSNMEWAMNAVIDSAQEIEAAKHDGIRLFDVPGHTTSPLPKEDLPGGRWQRCSPQSVRGFSAVGYFFGREFHQQTGVPVGLIGTNWGGTRIEPWTPPVGFRLVPELSSLATAVDRFDPATEAGKQTWKGYLGSVRAWADAAETSLDRESRFNLPPSAPGFNHGGAPTAIYNSMVNGLVPYGLRGALWYQGEANGAEGIEYHHKMRALIGGWREVWNQGEFPLYFYFVQLADWQQPNDNPEGGDGWARIREAQRRTLEVKHTGMAVITDIGNAKDIHPRNKLDVGKRLARWALRDVAGKEIVVSGPLYREMQIEGDRIRVGFDHVGTGLMVGKRKQRLEPTEEVPGGSLKRFAIAGEDKVWHWAKAEIEGESVVVSSPEVPKPVAVRYGFSMNPLGANLYNREGLPASPFRTDAW